MTYSDVLGGYAGQGNIDADPLFISPEWNDYRLQWGSPCIDAGDPDPQYNDPDSTRADMGAFYFDQSVPLRVLVTPFEMPIEIPATGGSFDYYIQVTNSGLLGLSVDVWCDVTLPNGNVFGPTLGPVNVEVGSEITLGRERTQNVPGGAPAGTYVYNAYATAGTDISTDSFTFEKLGSAGLDGLAGWFNTGESFEEIGEGSSTALQEEFALLGAYPNPFNPLTVLSFKLHDASIVNLAVYDISGRLVTTLVNGWRDAGIHEVTFDASGLPSGVYLYRLTAGEFSDSGKMVLMK
ncbi:hypothetical protein CEE37_04885 [candidate division LCP-89 bacterium B3_LCP]|uniref:Secretion system C-terminal sorting domain-containing protein n=1 Tax=candidate division LCP-89 bacterium B3_LCP TaxID=2012998 RepID=A0A532V1B0_UNCL8|nr:MAG: hypothetical protein CEE37_04885 [candidate division LCP-89 bacterium B3_LCP]